LHLSPCILGLNACICALSGYIISSTALSFDLPLKLCLDLTALFVVGFRFKKPAMELAFATGTKPLKFHNSVEQICSSSGEVGDLAI
jgi:hypothetical protein